jgi:hypothetical protein
LQKIALINEEEGDFIPGVGYKTKAMLFSEIPSAP